MRCCALLSWLTVSVLCLDAQSGGLAPDIREVTRKSNTKIADVMIPGETELMLVDVGDPPLAVTPEVPTSKSRWRTRHSDAVVIADARHKSSHLTPRGDWITSRVTLTVSQVLKPTSARLITAGTELMITEQGGELLVGAARVTAHPLGARLMTVGRRYLMFMNIDGETGEIGVGPGTIYERMGDGKYSILGTITNASGFVEDITGAFESQVVERIMSTLAQ